MFVIVEEMMLSEAALCSAPSRLFRGLCLSDSNCASICEQEGFLSGHCKSVGLKCICEKNCNRNGDSVEGLPEPEQGGGDQPSDVNRKFMIKS